jgi:hypothetical protein
MLGNDPEGNGKGYGFWDSVNLDVDWKVDQWLQAIGYDTESEEEGDFDTKDFVGKKIRGRVKSEFYGDEYRPKLARALPLGDVDDDDDEYDTGGSTVDDEPEPDPELEEVDMPTEDDLEAMKEPADEGDEDTIELLDRLGRQAGLDPNEYETWGELAEALKEYAVPAEKPAAKKSVAKKAAAPAKKAAAKPKQETEDSGENYEEWSLEDLKAEADSRSLSTGGSKTAIIARLRANDADPFSES